MVGQRRGLAESREIYRDDVAVLGQPLLNREPRLPPVSSPMQQDERRSRATPVICQLHPDTVSICNPPVTSALGYVTIVGELLTDSRVARRVAAVPQIRYPQALPISQHIGEIAAAIRSNLRP